MFEQYRQALAEDFPSLSIEGDTYPPSSTAQLLSNLVFLVRMVLLGLVLAGPGALQSLGIQQPPAWYMWMYENKVGLRVCVYFCESRCEVSCFGVW